jgi:phosphatidylserine/phosphatidylglycerophosphate/cardiolipin synthase-like enzyme
VLHAKCIVVDGRHALVTSANSTEAASQRTIEAGVLLVDTGLTPHYSRLLLLQARLPRTSRLSSSLLAAAHRQCASLRCSGRVRDSLRKPSFRDEVS